MAKFLSGECAALDAAHFYKATRPHGMFSAQGMPSGQDQQRRGMLSSLEMPSPIQGQWDVLSDGGMPSFRVVPDRNTIK